jgi:hypothetical protein
MDQRTSEDPGIVSKANSVKKNYAKPAFRYERAFETAALSCGKISPNERQCQFNKKTS